MCFDNTPILQVNQFGHSNLIVPYNGNVSTPASILTLLEVLDFPESKHLVHEGIR